MSDWIHFVREFFFKPRQEMTSAESGLIYSLIGAAPVFATVIHRMLDVSIVAAALAAFLGAWGVLLLALTAKYLQQK